jgi:hypothetical protein
VWALCPQLSGPSVAQEPQWQWQWQWQWQCQCQWRRNGSKEQSRRSVKQTALRAHSSAPCSAAVPCSSVSAQATAPRPWRSLCITRRRGAWRMVAVPPAEPCGPAGCQLPCLAASPSGSWSPVTCQAPGPGASAPRSAASLRLPHSLSCQEEPVLDLVGSTDLLASPTDTQPAVVQTFEDIVVTKEARNDGDYLSDPLNTYLQVSLADRHSPPSGRSGTGSRSGTRPTRPGTSTTPTPVSPPGTSRRSCLRWTSPLLRCVMGLMAHLYL